MEHQPATSRPTTPTLTLSDSPGESRPVPLPLLGQLEQRAPGAFAVEYLERGPETWRLQLVRHGG